MSYDADPLLVDGHRPAVAAVAALPSAWTTEAERLVLLALACDSYDGETSAPGYDNLAAWTGLHRSSVVGVVGRLQKPNARRPALLEVAETTRGRLRTRWRLTLEPAGEPDRSATQTGRQTQPVGQPVGLSDATGRATGRSGRPLPSPTTPIPGAASRSASPAGDDDATARRRAPWDDDPCCDNGWRETTDGDPIPCPVHKPHLTDRK